MAFPLAGFPTALLNAESKSAAAAATTAPRSRRTRAAIPRLASTENFLIASLSAKPRACQPTADSPRTTKSAARPHESFGAAESIGSISCSTRLQTSLRSVERCFSATSESTRSTISWIWEGSGIAIQPQAPEDGVPMRCRDYMFLYSAVNQLTRLVCQPPVPSVCKIAVSPRNK